MVRGKASIRKFDLAIDMAMVFALVIGASAFIIWVSFK